MSRYKLDIPLTSKLAFDHEDCYRMANFLENCTAFVIRGYLHSDLLVLRYEPEGLEVKPAEELCDKLYKKIYDTGKGVDRNNLRVFSMDIELLSSDIMVYALYEGDTCMRQREFDTKFINVVGDVLELSHKYNKIAYTVSDELDERIKKVRW